MDRISLADALASGDLEAFIQQEEGTGHVVDREEFERRLGALIKAPQPKGRTSRYLNSRKKPSHVLTWKVRLLQT